jgi:hypothetical protein
MIFLNVNILFKHKSEDYKITAKMILIIQKLTKYLSVRKKFEKMD